MRKEIQQRIAAVIAVVAVLFFVCVSQRTDPEREAAIARDNARNEAVAAVGGYIDYQECWDLADHLMDLDGIVLDTSNPAEYKRGRALRRDLYSQCSEGLWAANKSAKSVAGTRVNLNCKMAAQTMAAVMVCGGQVAASSSANG